MSRNAVTSEPPLREATMRVDMRTLVSREPTRSLSSWIAVASGAPNFSRVATRVSSLLSGLRQLGAGDPQRSGERQARVTRVGEHSRELGQLSR
jgi:hypothetical protein